MPKKFIISTLTALAISTLGCTVPTFADVNDVGDYTVSELVPIHAEYAEAMAECGPYKANDAAFRNCYNTVTSNFRTKYGGKFESMFQLDFNGRMIVTGLNPAAGTVRFYVDETKAYTDNSFTFENLVIFWVDGRTSPSPNWNDAVAWNIVDAYLNEEEIPYGVHLLYKGTRGEEGWATMNTENRFEYEPEGDFIRDNGVRFFFVAGYDTEGKKHIERQEYSGCNSEGGFTDGNECRLMYHYDGTSASWGYIETGPTAEDATVIRIKEAIESAREAEAAAREAEAAAREAERIALEAEMSAFDAEMAAREAKATADQATAAAREAEAAAREAEATANEATAVAREAEAAAREAEANAAASESVANEAIAAAREAEAEARALAAEATRVMEEANRVAEAATRASEEATRMSEEAARAAAEAKATAEEYANISADANKLAKTATKTADELSANFTMKFNELHDKIAALSTRISEINSDTKTIYVTSPVSTNKTTSEIVETATVTNDIAAKDDSASSVSEETMELPLAGNSEKKETKNEFPWWIIAFTFSGIALILWWFIPIRKKS